MALSDWANISQIVQAFLVVISFAVIGYQLWMSIKLAKAANSQSLTEHALSFNSLLIENKDVADLWYGYGKKLPAETDKYRYRELLCQWLILHENIYYQWRRGLLDEEVYRSWLGDLKHTIKHHNTAIVAVNLKELFPSAFGNHLIQLAEEVKERPAPTKAV